MLFRSGTEPRKQSEISCTVMALTNQIPATPRLPQANPLGSPTNPGPLSWLLPDARHWAQGSSGGPCSREPGQGDPKRGHSSSASWVIAAAEFNPRSWWLTPQSGDSGLRGRQGAPPTPASCQLTPQDPSGPPGTHDGPRALQMPLAAGGPVTDSAHPPPSLAETQPQRVQARNTDGRGQSPEGEEQVQGC